MHDIIMYRISKMLKVAGPSASISFVLLLQGEAEISQPNAKESVQALLYIVILKMKYDESYSFGDEVGTSCYRLH